MDKEQVAKKFERIHARVKFAESPPPRRLHKQPQAKNLPWRTMLRDPETYVKGRITHPNHKTIDLPLWHPVVPNTESQARAMRNVAFLD